ncbi:MAG: hypothetical protein KatS3mg108_2334 [Isosphaeraceae bacterium]|jgi:hypothetical protein|nr:MAG: hypothetical protein KatS3mg108_2334 [Isosphaeraceae bacterium]
MRTPPLRLAFAAVFGRIFLVTFAIQQFTAFHKTRHQLRLAGPAAKFEAFLDFTPYALVLALLVAALASVGLDALVRFVLRPLAGVWYHPGSGRTEATPLAFHLAPGESLEASCPARIRSAQGWRPGTLVLTSQSLTHYPCNWDAEPCRIPRTELRSLRIEPARAVLGSFLLGWPGRLVIRAADGRELTLAVADPSEILAWFVRSI